MSLPEAIAQLPVVVRSAVVGSILAGIVGAAVGLVQGLRTYVPTAWAAIFEIGVPAALLGGLVGIGVGGASVLVKRARAH